VESTKKAQEIALAQFLKHRQYDKIFLQCSLVESTQQAQEKSLKEAVIKKQKERERLIAQEKVIDEVLKEQKAKEQLLKEQKAKEQLLKEQKAKETEIYEFLEKKMIASSDFEPGNEKISFENFKRKQMILALLDTQTYFFIDKKKVLFKIEQMEYQTYNSLFYAITQNGTKLERVEPIIGIEWVKKNQSKEKKHIDFSTVRRKIYKDIEENKNKPIGIDNLTIKDLFEDPTCPLKDWIDKGTVSGVDLIRFMNFFYKDQGLKQINLFNYNYTIDNFFLNKDKLITNMSEFTLNQAVFKLDQNHTFFKIDKKKIQINNDIFIYTASQPASNNFEHLNIIHEDDL
jgi:hypothetical protein